MQMRDGKVVDMTALTDSVSLNELLERVADPGMHQGTCGRD
jgi:hypothetical protein